MREALYDVVADLYQSGWPDSYDDSVSVALLHQIGPVEGREVVDLACGHGRMTRELARRGAHVVGADISHALIAKAETAERQNPLGVRYVHADITSPDIDLGRGRFDLAVCHFGLSDIGDLGLALGTVVRHLHPAGRFVFSILHPCFPGGRTDLGLVANDRDVLQRGMVGRRR